MLLWIQEAGVDAADKNHGLFITVTKCLFDRYTPTSLCTIDSALLVILTR